MSVHDIPVCLFWVRQIFIAMGFFALTIVRRWRKWARREAGMRRLFERLSKGDAVRRWKKAVTLDAFQAILQRLAVRDALHRWKRELNRRAAFEMAVGHSSRNLVSKVRRADTWWCVGTAIAKYCRDTF